MSNNTDNTLLLCVYNNNISYAKRNSFEIKTNFINKFLSFTPNNINKDNIKQQIYCIDKNIFEDIENLFKDIKNLAN